MQRITLTDNLNLSRIIYGMWRLADDKNTSSKHVQAKIESCLSQGITSFDQADIYGNYASENALGACLKDAPQLRDQMQIITKCNIMLVSEKYPKRRVKHYDTSAAHIHASVDASLNAMNIDHIDMLLMHRPDPLMDATETGKALDAVVASGKVGAVGVSNFKLHDWNLLQSTMSQPLLTNQIEISLVANQAFTNGDIAYLQERSVPPMAWSPLAGGSLFAAGGDPLLVALKDIAEQNNVDISAVALAWLLTHPSNIMPVVGTNNLERIAKIDAATRVHMDRETWYVLYEAALGQEVP